MNTLAWISKFIVAVLTACLSFASAQAQWSYVSLHPSTAAHSQAFGIGGGKQIGTAMFGSSTSTLLWSGSKFDYTTISSPDGAEGHDTTGIQHIGYRNWAPYMGGLWTGSPLTYISLLPAGYWQCKVFKIDAGQQAGWVQNFSDQIQAAVWSGSAESFVILTPVGADSSMALACAEGSQVGFSRILGQRHASLWYGTPGSHVDLTPAGYSYALCEAVGYGTQGGQIYNAPSERAALWRGSAASYVDLHPMGTTRSKVYGIARSRQVGYAYSNTQRAALWSGTAGSYVNLHSYLPSRFSSSVAYDAYDDGQHIYVVGYANDTTAGRTEAVMWVGPPATPRMTPISNKTIAELSTLAFSAPSTGQSLSYDLIDAPSGATINPLTGQFSWTPTEEQGPGVYVFTIRVIEGGNPNLHDELPVTVTVTEANVAPTLETVPDQTIDEETLWTYQLIGADTDLPFQPLTYSTVGTPPGGLTVNPQSGMLQWSPTESQGPGNYQVTAQVADSLGSTQQRSFMIAVREVTKIIAGSVELQDFVGAVIGQTVSIEIRPAGNPNASLVRLVTLSPTGTFQFTTNSTNLPPGNYDITAKGVHWLRRLLPSVPISASGTNAALFRGTSSLMNGDADGDNEVGIGDYSIISAAYNSFPGDPAFDPMADLNGDDSVDIADYAILSSNFGEVGDE